MQVVQVWCRLAVCKGGLPGGLVKWSVTGWTEGEVGSGRLQGKDEWPLRQGGVFWPFKQVGMQGCGGGRKS